VDDLTTNHPFFYRHAQIVAQILTKLLFNLEVEGSQFIPKHGGALIVSNHQSNLDPVVLGAFLDRPLNFVGKAELFANPFAAWIMHRLNAFPLRQGKGDIGAVKETINRLREGHILNLYPEASRTPDGQIHPFERGVGLIVRRANVPVIPATIIGAFDAWPIHRSIWRMKPIRVKFGPPLNLTGLHSDKEITAAIEREVRRMFQEMQWSVASSSNHIAVTDISCSAK
jgi:1-acyl-sn-glycerol-3-phosphate acyltransferase